MKKYDKLLSIKNNNYYLEGSVFIQNVSIDEALKSFQKTKKIYEQNKHKDS